MKKYKLTYLLTIILIGFSNCISAQNNAIIKYYDSFWMSTSKNAAFYFTEFIKEDTFYRCTSYWMKSKKLNCKSTYSDTLFSKPIGILLRYYENGQTEDSTFYENGTLKNTFHYYPNGNLWVHYSYNKESKEQITEAYDMDGNKLKDFIYLKEASFPGGQSAWVSYLAEKIKTKVPVKNGAPIGTYQVIIRFIVDKNGEILNPQAETNAGYGMEEEGIRVIKKSPKWIPGISLGETKISYRRQPLTFIVK